MEGFWWSLDANEISGTWSASRLDGAVLENLIEPKMTGEPPLVPWWNQGFRWQVSCFSWAVGRFGPDMQTAAGKPWNLCSFARMKRHTLTTLSGMSWGQQVHTGMSTYSTRPQEQRGSLCVLWMQLCDEVDLKRFLAFSWRFKQTCSEQQEEHGGRRGAWMQLGHSQDSWWLVKRLHDP